MGWDTAREARSAMATGDGIWLKLADGEEVKIVILGSPAHVTKPPFNPADPDSKPRQRFEVNVMVAESEQIKIWDMSGTVFDNVSALHEKGRTKGRWLFLSRKGAGLDTKYQIIPGDKLTTEEVEPCKTARLHEIGQAAVDIAPSKANGDLSSHVAVLTNAADQEQLESGFKAAWSALGESDREALQDVYNKRSAAFQAGTDLPF